MAHKTTYEESRQKQPVKVVNRTDTVKACNEPMTSSVERDGHDNGVHQEFLVDTVQH
jgi:hypothetical protein